MLRNRILTLAICSSAGLQQQIRHVAHKGGNKGSKTNSIKKIERRDRNMTPQNTGTVNNRNTTGYDPRGNVNTNAWLSEVRGNRQTTKKTEKNIRTIKEWEQDKKAEKAARGAGGIMSQLQDIGAVVDPQSGPPKLHWHNNAPRKRLGHCPKHGPWLFQAHLPRRSCYKYGTFSGTPCPCCRAKWIPNYKDVHILKDYVDPVSMTVLPLRVTGVCQVKQRMLTEALLKAQSYGLMKLRPSKPIRSWGDREVYGKHSSQIYGLSQVYHTAYRHLPGNIYYEKGNKYWEHYKVTTASQGKDHCDYE